MPNTKSAERRMRGSARKATQNRRVSSRLKTLELSYIEVLKSGSRDSASAAFRAISSALDKAAKSGVIHSARADRKKSRLALRLNAVK